jgi:hypothetical protein
MALYISFCDVLLSVLYVQSWKTPLSERVGTWNVEKSSLTSVISACENISLTISTLDPGEVKVHGRNRSGYLMASRMDEGRQRFEKVEDLVHLGAARLEGSDASSKIFTKGVRRSPYVKRSFGIFSLDNPLRKFALRLCTVSSSYCRNVIEYSHFGQKRHLLV